MGPGAGTELQGKRGGCAPVALGMPQQGAQDPEGACEAPICSDVPGLPSLGLRPFSAAVLLLLHGCPHTPIAQAKRNDLRSSVYTPSYPGVVAVPGLLPRLE